LEPAAETQESESVENGVERRQTQLEDYSLGNRDSESELSIYSHNAGSERHGKAGLKKVLLLRARSYMT
jgi:hypothetical protein